MTINELKESGMNKANLYQIYQSLLSGIKKDFLRMCLKERESQLNQQITSHPAFCLSNGAYKVDWGYWNGDSQDECYELDGLLYQLNALKSAICKL